MLQLSSISCSFISEIAVVTVVIIVESFLLSGGGEIVVCSIKIIKRGSWDVLVLSYKAMKNKTGETWQTK